MPTDFSAASTEAVRYAAFFARWCNAGITLLHVVEPPNYPAWGYAYLSLRDEPLKKKARGKLETLGTELPSDLATQEVVMTGDAALKIVEAAEEQKSDLIVISAHSHTGLRRLLLGSVTGKVVRLAPCPVLTIPGQHSATRKSTGPCDTRS